MAGHEINKCNIAEDGVCALHGVEVERRRNASTKFLVAYSLILFILAGSFIYTRDVKLEADFKNQNISNTVDILSREISTLVTMQARADERYNSVLREMESLNKQIAAMLSLHTKDIGSGKK